jgi:hypothetical protein
MKYVFLLLLTLAPVATAVTLANDDSCDLALLPAATLLLPYFEVDLESAAIASTRFTITNVTSAERSAQVTLWTDRGYPVVSVHLALTGYDQEVIDLFEVITRERIGEAFIGGEAGGCSGISGFHVRAIGYATIDVVAPGTNASVSDSVYWTRDLRYDNALTGDYQTTRGADATGGPLVHIRAIPEGGTPETRRALPAVYDAGFARTFYARHQSRDTARLDGRQPLPSRFTSHWIQGPGISTVMSIWREGLVRADAPCSAYASNARLAAEDIVRFDETELGIAQSPDSQPVVRPSPLITLPLASRMNVADAAVFPQMPNGATSGWMALNLAVSRHDPAGSQAWVVASMSTIDGLSVDVEASALGNGCSRVEPISNFRTGGGVPVEPSPNVNRTARPGRASVNNDDSCDVGLYPAATLLLPHFRVDTEPARSVTTLFSVTNTTPQERIARITLWTDYSYPVLTFNVYLTGYDMQSIDLYDVIVRGVVAPDTGTGTAIAPRGSRSIRNREISLSGCELLPGALTSHLTKRMSRAFTEGFVPECEEVGNVHSWATGYATIDVVRNCATTGPTESSYWSRDLGFENVLTGDYQVVDRGLGAADGAPLVHIRAVPEGGGDSPFGRTFYSRYSRGRDVRQPLPTTFAVPWTAAGGVDAATFFEVWREGVQGANACGELDRSQRRYTDVVLFDDRENSVSGTDVPGTGPFPVSVPRLPSTSRTHILDHSIYPRMPNGVTQGWAYFDLQDPDDRTMTQAWIAATHFVRGRSSFRHDAIALGNGCSPAVLIDPAP